MSEISQIVVAIRASLATFREQMSAAADEVSTAGARMEASTAGVEAAVTSMNTQVAASTGAVATSIAGMGDAIGVVQTRVVAQIADLGILDTILNEASVSTAELAAQEESLDRMVLAGLISTGEQARALEKLTALELAQTAALDKNTGAVVANRSAHGHGGAMYMSDRGPRMGLFSAMMSVGAWLITPIGLAFTAVTVALGTFAAAAILGEEAQKHLNETFALTGGILGITKAQYQALPAQMANVALSADRISGALQAVARSGEYTGAQLRTVTAGVASMSLITGEKVGQVLTQFESLGKQPVRALQRLNEQYHFLTQSQFDEIDVLVREHKMHEVGVLDQTLLAQAMAKRALDIVKNEGRILQALHAEGRAWERLWHKIEGIRWEWLWDKIEGIGAAKTAQEQLDAINRQINKINKNELALGPKGSWGLVGAFPASSTVVDIERTKLVAKRIALLAQAKPLETKITDEKKKAVAFAQQQAAIQRKMNQLVAQAIAHPAGAKGGASLTPDFSGRLIAIAHKLTAAQTMYNATKQAALAAGETMGLGQIAQARRNMRFRVQMGKEGLSQEFADLVRFENKSYQLKLTALKEALKLEGEKPAFYARVRAKIEQLDQQHVHKLEQLAHQQQIAIEKEWLQLFSVVTIAVDQSIKGMIRGATTWHNAMRNIFQSVLGEFIDMAVKMAAKWVATQVGFTSVTAAATASRMAIEKEAEVQSVAIAAAAAVKRIAIKAWEVIASVYSAIAGIYIVGPFLAPVMAAAAGAYILSLASRVASAAGGWEVPGDQLAMVHKDEMILPAHIAQPLKHLAQGGGSTVNLHVHAVDGESVRRLFLGHSEELAEALVHAHRNGLFA